MREGIDYEDIAPCVRCNERAEELEWRNLFARSNLGAVGIGGRVGYLGDGIAYSFEHREPYLNEVRLVRVDEGRTAHCANTAIDPLMLTRHRAEIIPVMGKRLVYDVMQPEIERLAKKLAEEADRYLMEVMMGRAT